MDKPITVQRAEIGIWLMMTITAFVAILDRHAGVISSALFFASLALNASCAIIPYKIGQGRNWARYWYAVNVAFCVAVLLAGEASDLPKLDIVAAVITLPLEFWIVWNLFRKESTSWFQPAKPIA